MLNRLPRQMPPLSLILEDIGNPKPKEIARALCVSEAIVKKWIKAGDAPHPVMLAMFWLTRWGRSAVDCEAHNAAIMSAGIARNRQDQIDILEKRIQRLAQIAYFGAANDPASGVVAYKSMPQGVSTTISSAVESQQKPSSPEQQKPGSTQQPCGLQHG